MTNVFVHCGEVSTVIGSLFSHNYLRQKYLSAVQRLHCMCFYLLKTCVETVAQCHRRCYAGRVNHNRAETLRPTTFADCCIVSK